MIVFAPTQSDIYPRCTQLVLCPSSVPAFNTMTSYFYVELHWLLWTKRTYHRYWDALYGQAEYLQCLSTVEEQKLDSKHAAIFERLQPTNFCVATQPVAKLTRCSQICNTSIYKSLGLKDTWKVAVAPFAHPFDYVLSNVTQRGSFTILHTRKGSGSKKSTIVDSLRRAVAIANDQFDLCLWKNIIRRLYRTTRNLVM